jgi:hypothetical protein
VGRSHVIRPRRNLATTQARTELPAIVSELIAVTEPGETLADNAVEVGPRNRGGVWLLPAVDIDAAIEREDELRERVAELEDEAENLAFGFYLLQRRERSSGESVSGADFIRELGFDDLADDLPG